MNIRKTIAVRRGLLTVHALALDAYESGILEKPPRWHAQDAAELQRALDWIQEQASSGFPPLSCGVARDACSSPIKEVTP